MYNSESHNKNQYRWIQSQPKTHSPDIPWQRLRINDKPVNVRNWRISREHHAGQAAYESNATTQLLDSLPDDYTIFKGSISMPHKSPEEWRIFKARFTRLLKTVSKSQGMNIQFVGKQHITLGRGKDSGSDDMHYDYVAYVDCLATEYNIKELWLDCIDRAGGQRHSSSVTLMNNRDRANLQRISDYTFKSPGQKHKAKFMSSFPLPGTSFPVIWITRSFYQKPKQEVTTTRIFNGKEQTKTKTISSKQLSYREWIQSWAGDDVPEYTTHDYRIHTKIQELYLHDAKPMPDYKPTHEQRNLAYTITLNDLRAMPHDGDYLISSPHIPICLITKDTFDRIKKWSMGEIERVERYYVSNASYQNNVGNVIGTPDKEYQDNKYQDNCPVMSLHPCFADMSFV